MAELANTLPGCAVAPSDLRPCLQDLRAFSSRYAPHFNRVEQREHAVTYIEGRLSNLPRKTIEPIAIAHDQYRRGLQRFVGAGAYDDSPLIDELKTHVAEEIGDPSAVLVLDPSCFEKKGDDSVGVARQWNGRLGKIDNCQKAVLMAYAAPTGFAIIDERLYLPEAWAGDAVRREKCDVPEDITFKTSLELGLDLVDGCKSLPHAWVAGDDEFGRSAEFRAALRTRKERYVLDVPSNTLVRPIHQLPRGKRGPGRPPGNHASRASDWARARKSGAWVRILTRDGTKGPVYVEATSAIVETRLDQSFGPRERIIAIRTVGPNPDYSYCLTNAGPEICIGALVGVHAARHCVEEAINRAKGEAGLAHYEVRSWVGWHHHMTLSLLASWFLTLERNRLGEKYTDADSPADLDRVAGPSRQSEDQPECDRLEDHSAACAEREVADRPLAH